jgi:hypothetical protein
MNGMQDENQLGREIAATDRQIDQLVGELFWELDGLSGERIRAEIRIVEEATG